MDRLQNKIIFPAEVVNNQDPLNIGRVRAYPLDKNVRAALDGFGFKDPQDLWGPKDPFVCLPLFPMFFSQVPEVKERVNLIYQNKEYPYQDIYYVQGAFSSPMSYPLETIEQSNNLTSLGDRIKGTLPLKNLDGSFKNVKSFGIFPQPGDNALLGRGASDVIVKKNGVLIRASKTKNLNPNQFPIANSKSAFLQVSEFDTRVEKGKQKTLIKTTPVSQQIKKLIEWDIDNLENMMEQFTGSIRLYSLKPTTQTLSDNIQYDSNLDSVRSLEYYENFTNLPFEEAVNRINRFIQGVNDGKIVNGPSVNEQFPFVYRPNVTIRNVLTTNSVLSNLGDPLAVISYSNSLRFLNKVTLNPGLGIASYKFGMVRSKGEIGKPFKVELETVTPKNVINDSGTFVGLGGDTLFLISHKSNKPVDTNGTIYGFTQEQLENRVLPNTSSMVRGEELIQLLNLIVQFLVAHVHPIPGAAPVPVALDNTSAIQILTELQNAQNKILSPNIRIN